MNTLKESSLICNCDDETFKFFLDSDQEKIYLSENISPEFVLLVDRFIGKEYKVVYIKSIKKCPVCGSKLNKNGTDSFLLNKSREIRKHEIMFAVIRSVRNTQGCV